jgi:hypothetical protein
VTGIKRASWAPVRARGLDCTLLSTDDISWSPSGPDRFGGSNFRGFGSDEGSVRAVKQALRRLPPFHSSASNSHSRDCLETGDQSSSHCLKPAPARPCWFRFAGHGGLPHITERLPRSREPNSVAPPIAIAREAESRIGPTPHTITHLPVCFLLQTGFTPPSSRSLRPPRPACRGRPFAWG